MAVQALMSTATAVAQQLSIQRVTGSDATVCGLPVSNLDVKRNDALFSIDMDYNLKDVNLKGDRVTVFTPVLRNGADSLEFASVGLYSRIRYIQYMRYGKPLGGEDETSFRYKQRPEMLEYAQTVPYEAWMNGAQLYMRRCDYGCCRTLIDEEDAPFGGWHEISALPAFHYVKPEAELEKMRELSGRAYIDFPVNRTEIYPEYRKNPTELMKIIGTIDSVRNDADVTVKRITIKGYASPESPWSNNTRLAKGRTATLKQYVQNLYRFPEGFIETDYEPEDWDGLREYVENSALEHRDEILAIINDTSLEPDPREWRLKSRYPEEYRFLLATVYPGLRHSDYTIEYTIRLFNDVEDIRRMMETAPQKLSLNEMYVLAQTLDEGSEEYDEVFETAVRMYPSDETANLNAANSAMRRGDLTNAKKYLAKAGDSDAATYARGIYALLNSDFDTAAELYEKAAETIPEAADALKSLNDVRGELEQQGAE